VWRRFSNLRIIAFFMLGRAPFRERFFVAFERVRKSNAELNDRLFRPRCAATQPPCGRRRPAEDTHPSLSGPFKISPFAKGGPRGILCNSINDDGKSKSGSETPD
jgi:hypothetical protein